MPAGNPVKILIPFNAGGLLYGMERAVIEMFDFLRPRVTPHFLLSHGMFRESLAALTEVQRRGLSYAFFGRTSPWPVIGKPHSPAHAWRLFLAMLKGNRDVLKEAVKCDALYLPGIRYFFFAIPASVYCLITGKPIIYQFHELAPRPMAVFRFLRFVVRDFIHTTQAGYRISSEANPCLLKRNNHVIPLVLRPPETCGSDGLPEAFSPGKRTILFVGQVSLHKGIDLLLQAMALIDGHPDVVLLVIGGCAPEFKPSFDALLADERIANRVVYLGYRQDVFRFLAGAYVYVHPTPPSRCLESFGLSALEAMACGVPTVCFRAGAIQEVVVDRETGLICEREDAGCLAENLRQFLDDRQFRDRCGSNAAVRFRTVYSPQRVAAGWERLLAEH